MIDIQGNQAFHKLCIEIEAHQLLAIDTEFIRERTYYPRLALIQVAFGDSGPILIDPLTIDDWEPFHRILADESTVKILHAARQDLEIFYYQSGQMPQNVFDTQIAASMCGLGEQLGYAGLVQKTLDVRLAKGHSYTNWLQRPLSKAQERYAREDVRYLETLYLDLMRRAQELGRVAWIREETQSQLPDDLFEFDPESSWHRVKRAASLARKDLVVLQRLSLWREKTARRLDKPVRFILSDEALIDLSRIGELNIEQMRRRRHLSKGFIKRHGEEILEIHDRSRQVPKEDWPEPISRGHKPSAQAEMLSELAWVLVQLVGSKFSIAPAHIIMKRDLPRAIDHLFQGRMEHEVFSGWRREMAGHLIEQLCQGQLALVFEDGQVIWRRLGE